MPGLMKKWGWLRDGEVHGYATGCFLKSKASLLAHYCNGVDWQERRSRPEIVLRVALMAGVVQGFYALTRVAAGGF